MPRYQFALSVSPMRTVAEVHSNDAAAKRHACNVVDEVNRNAKSCLRVLLWDNEGDLLAAVSSIGE